MAALLTEDLLIRNQAAFNKILSSELGLIDGMRNPLRNTSASKKGACARAPANAAKTHSARPSLWIQVNPGSEPLPLAQQKLNS